MNPTNARTNDSMAHEGKPGTRFSVIAETWGRRLRSPPPQRFPVKTLLRPAPATAAASIHGDDEEYDAADEDGDASLLTVVALGARRSRGRSVFGNWLIPTVSSGEAR